MDSCIPKITQIFHCIFYAIFLLTKSFLTPYFYGIISLWHMVNITEHLALQSYKSLQPRFTWEVTTSVEGPRGGFGEK